MLKVTKHVSLIIAFSVTALYSQGVLRLAPPANAAEPAKPAPSDEVKQKASNAMHDLGKNMDKAGKAIKSTVDDATRDKDGKGNLGQKVERGAKVTMEKIEAGANTAEHAIVKTVNQIGKNATKGSANKPSEKGDKGPTLSQSMQTFGKNAEKAGTALENGVKKLGSNAAHGIKKADQSIKTKTQN